MLDHHMLHAKSLRPLIPRPTALTTRDTMFSANPHTCFLNSYNSRATSFSAWNSHLIDGETGFLTNNVEPLLATPRWNPKPEQIQALEEMYKKGLRTPSAEQIQKIAAKLRKFGKIEGKNVFYWFQNHKARERQKRRRLMNVNNHPQLAEKHDNNIGTNMGLKKPGGINIKCMDVESPKKSTYSTCGSISEDFVSKNITVKAESKTNAWAQTRIKKTTIQMDMSPLLPNYYIFSTRITTQQSSKQPCNDDKIEEKISIRNNQILQLFPLGINNQSDSSPKEMEESGMVIANNMALSPRQFYEFLPLKS